MIRKAAALLPLALAVASGPAPARSLIEPPMLAPLVEARQLPPLAERIPAEPSVVDLAAVGGVSGQYGGTLRTLMAYSKDARLITVYGYARLAAYDRNLEIVPDILADVDVEDGRVFTLRLRRGHRWSDGHPFTSEDFRYWWMDVALDDQLSPAGPPVELVVDGARPEVAIVDETTVRYAWPYPNPRFLPALAGARPLYIYAPAHYLKRFHARYADPKELQERVEAERQRNWAALHTRKAHAYDNDNPELPSLQPWIARTTPPSERFVFERNPYFHRIDRDGRQLPYIDRIAMVIANAKLIPAKTGAGESDLQARYLSFNNYTFLKNGEARNPIRVLLWSSARGSYFALYPNLNASDPVWREVLRKADFRRALSMGIDRHEINQVIFYGLATEMANTVLPRSPLFEPEYAHAWADFDPVRANALLDRIGLTARDDDGFRKLPDGRTLEIVVDTVSDMTEHSDILELIGDSWEKIGVKLFVKPLQRDVFRNRLFAGRTIMSAWSGLENGLATSESSPAELAPTSQLQPQWPKWGQYVETGGRAGEPVDMDRAKTLVRLNKAWRYATGPEARKEAWRRILEIHADQVYSIGVVGETKQPVVVHRSLRNVPAEGVYNWDPGAMFGIYRPDTFWFDDPQRRGS